MVQDRAEGQFGQLVVMLGFASPIAVTECIRLQRSLAEKGQFKPLGQILAERGVLTVDQIRQVLLRQGKTFLACTSCHSKFNLADPYSGDLFKCRICGSAVKVYGTPDEIEEEENDVIKEDPLVGETLASCRIQALLGEDAVSRSYKAWQMSSQRDVVMRVLKERHARDKTLIKKFLKEAAAAAKVHHPAVAPIHDVGQAEGYFYVCHAYFEGATLREKVEEEGPLPVRQAAGIALHLIGGMRAAHKAGVVHRDIRPGTVLFPTGRPKPVLMGLGLVKRAAETSEEGDIGILHGSPEFMAPEQIQDYSSADARSDMFSLGAVFWYMLVGKSPFRGNDPVESLARNLEGRRPKLADVADGVPRRLCAIIDRMLDRHPDKRFASLEEANTALESLDAKQLPLSAATEKPHSPVMDVVGERLELEPEEESYEKEEPRLELMPPEPEIRLADEPDEKKEKEEVDGGAKGGATLSKEEKKRILEEAFRGPGEPTPPSPATEKKEEAAAERSEPTPLKQTLIEKAPFIAGGVVFLVLIIVLIAVLGKGEKPATGGDGGRRARALSEAKAMLTRLEKEHPDGYDLLRARAEEYLRTFQDDEAARNYFLRKAEGYKRAARRAKRKAEWEALQKEARNASPDRMDAMIAKLKDFARRHIDTDEASAAMKEAKRLESRRELRKAEAEVERIRTRVMEDCESGSYQLALQRIKDGLPWQLKPMQSRFSDAFQKMRDLVRRHASARFEEMLARARRREKEGLIPKAEEELKPALGWGLEEFAEKARREVAAMKARYKRRVMLARIRMLAAVDAAFTEAASGLYQKGLARLEAVRSESTASRLFGKRLETAAAWIEAAARFQRSHLSYLKSAVGSQVTGLVLRSNIDCSGKLVSFDEKKGVLRVKTKMGAEVEIKLADLKRETVEEFARRGLPADERALCEAAHLFLHGDDARSLKALGSPRTAVGKALLEAVQERVFMREVTRHRRLLFSANWTRVLSREKGKFETADVGDEFGDALRSVGEGVLRLPEAVLPRYVLRLQVMAEQTSAPLRIRLPYSKFNVVHLDIPVGGEGLRVAEAAGQETFGKTTLCVGEWFDIEIRFLDGVYTVSVDGRTVLKVVSVQTSGQEKDVFLRLIFPEGRWLIREMYLLEAP